MTIHVMEQLEQALQKKVPAAALRLDPPLKPGGNWWLDAQFGSHLVAVEWRPKRGFGISAGEAGIGEGPDEVYLELKPAVQRISHLLRSGERTQPPQEVLLQRLRDLRNMTQTQLAERLHVTQATISKWERQSDMYLSTLRGFVSALGGRLETRAVFPDGVVDISLLEAPSEPKATAKARPSPKKKARSSAAGR